MDDGMEPFEYAGKDTLLELLEKEQLFFIESVKSWTYFSILMKHVNDWLSFG